MSRVAGGLAGRNLSLAVASVLALTHGVAARDGNIRYSLRAAAAQPPARSIQARSVPFAPSRGRDQGARPSSRAFADRPLTVHLHDVSPLPSAAAGYSVSPVPRKPAVVLIRNDGTLRRGDAVMTTHGIRIFVGSGALPHRDGDFVALARARELSRDTAKVLVDVDRVSQR